MSEGIKCTRCKGPATAVLQTYQEVHCSDEQCDYYEQRDVAPPVEPPQIKIPPHWAAAMQLQLKNRATAKEKVSIYMLAHGVQNDQQMIDMIQAFLDETGKSQTETKFLVGPEASFQMMVLGLAGVALVDLVLEMVLDGLRKQAADREAADGVIDPVGPTIIHGIPGKSTGATPDDPEKDDNGQKPRILKG